MVTREDIERARDRIRGVIRATPLDRSDTLSRILGRPVALKPEHLQRTGSFKIRGATNFVATLPAGSQVVAASAGNHAQGVALAAARAGLRSTVFMPASAALPKVEATQNYGATVEFVPGTVDDAIAAAKAFAADRGAVFVPPFDDPLVIAGQGTIGLELAEEAPDAEVVVVPVGGGGLISGIAAALKLSDHPNRPRVVGVEPTGAACMAASVAAGQPVRLDSLTTMADGVAIKVPSALTLEHVQAYVDEIVTVDDDDIARAVVLLLERAKAVVEPAGATALAALLAGKVSGRGPSGRHGGKGLAVAVLSGGNVDPFLLLQLIDRGLSASGRYLILRVQLADRPGALAALTAAVADMGLNVLAVEHHRSGLLLPLEQVEVVLTLETRDPEHRAEVVEALQRQGYRVEMTG